MSFFGRLGGCLQPHRALTVPFGALCFSAGGGRVPDHRWETLLHQPTTFPSCPYQEGPNSLRGKLDRRPMGLDSRPLQAANQVSRFRAHLPHGFLGNDVSLVPSRTEGERWVPWGGCLQVSCPDVGTSGRRRLLPRGDIRRKMPQMLASPEFCRLQM